MCKDCKLYVHIKIIYTHDIMCTHQINNKDDDDNNNNKDDDNNNNNKDAAGDNCNNYYYVNYVYIFPNVLLYNIYLNAHIRKHQRTSDINEEHTRRLPVVVRVSRCVFDSVIAPAQRRRVRAEC